jgi:hypothetical protein
VSEYCDYHQANHPPVFACAACHNAALTALKTLVDGQAVIIAEMAEHLAILRTGIVYMLMQAQADEVDQTEQGNPWLKLRKDFVALLNPHVRRLNTLLGIKAPDQQEPPKIAVVTK